MEAELLREMIADRDKRIEKVQRKMDEQKERENQLGKELEQIRQQSFQQKEQHRQEQKEIIREYKISLEKLSSLQHDFEHQRKSLNSYLGKIRPDQATDPAFIMRMQAQLCKAMHSMGILEHQFELSKTHSESLIKYHRDQIAKTTEERTQIELKLMNDLVIRDTERCKIEEKFTQQMNEINKECEALERQMEENRGSDDESEDDDNVNEKHDDDESEPEPDDEAEKQAKEELMKILQTHKQEIENLEAEIEEKEEMIQEMEEQRQLIQDADNEAGELVNGQNTAGSSYARQPQQQPLNNSSSNKSYDQEKEEEDENEEDEEAPEMSPHDRLQQLQIELASDSAADVEDISAEALLARVHAKFSPSQEEKKETSLEESEEDGEHEDIPCESFDDDEEE
jgi:hypothetical protein